MPFDNTTFSTGISIGDYTKAPIGSDSPFKSRVSPSDKNTNWESFSKDTDWNQELKVDRNKLFEMLFDKAKSRDTYRDQVEQRARDEERRGYSWGGGSTPSGFTPGGAQRVTEDASIYTPSQIAPFTVAGVQGSGGGGLFGDIGGAAGMLGTAFGVFGPLGAPIGAMAGKFIDRAVG